MRAVVVLLALSAGGAARAQPVDSDPWFAPDKALHFGVSAAIAGAGYAGAAFFSDEVPVRLAVGGGIALLAGIGKELADLAGLGQPSWKDLAWDVAGIAVGLGVAWLVDWAFFRRGRVSGPASLTQGEGQHARRDVEALFGQRVLQHAQ